MATTNTDVDRIALVSDIHGNELAFQAVLENIRQRDITRIYCLGDVATLGPKPLECIRLVQEYCTGFICGNHDRYLLEDTLKPDSHNRAPPVQHAIEWCRKQINDETRAILESSHATLTIPLGNTKLLLYHGSPRSDVEDWTQETPNETIQEGLAHFIKDKDDVTICCGGHTHMFMKRRVGDQWVISVGSVGVPFASPPKKTGEPPKILPCADYTILSCNNNNKNASSIVDIEHIRLPLDRNQLIQAAEEWEYTELGKQLATMYAEAI